jgi:hypothetical protein
MNRLDRSLDSKETLDLDDLGKFCEMFNVKFVRADMTHERGFREPMYFFSDNLGGYNIDAVRSLEDF